MVDRIPSPPVPYQFGRAALDFVPMFDRIIEKAHPYAVRTMDHGSEFPKAMSAYVDLLNELQGFMTNIVNGVLVVMI